MTNRVSLGFRPLRCGCRLGSALSALASARRQPARPRPPMTGRRSPTPRRCGAARLCRSRDERVGEQPVHRSCPQRGREECSKPRVEPLSDGNRKPRIERSRSACGAVITAAPSLLRMSASVLRTRHCEHLASHRGAHSTPAQLAFEVELGRLGPLEQSDRATGWIEGEPARAVDIGGEHMRRRVCDGVGGSRNRWIASLVMP